MQADRVPFSSTGIDDLRAAERLAAIVCGSEERLRVLRTVAQTGAELNTCVFAVGGYVRNAIWDHVCGTGPHGVGDIDLIVLDDRAPEVLQALERQDALQPWSTRSVISLGHPTLESVLGDFPETASAIAVRLVEPQLEIYAPYGLDDLFAGIIRAPSKHLEADLIRRMRTKGWNSKWPCLTFVPCNAQAPK